MDRIYCGASPVPAELWTRWNLDPVLLAALALLLVAVRRSVSGRLAVAVLFVAFVSPLCALSSALFSARVVHHVLLVAVAAPLLARTTGPRATGAPALALAILSVTLWAWHWPAAYDLALSHVGVYWLMQLTLLGAAIWFWRAVLAPGRAPVEAMTLIVAGFAQMGMLGAILTFAPRPLYEAHLLAPFAWGLTPLDDQQLGGLLMWVPAGLPYAVAAFFVARRGWTALRQAPA
ncbi:cytochrome c oxidase assembly protein [uncultured Jannaschia sp.]|uniref:cytochrome c oxidase assembly protein n=1 Tax=uncultured Jannaschia sp. TaxID=293347 RepID=UPI002619059D|nr:cytochrome c oxidase assembly protein [uncultured Jannaschia sp.]